MAAITINIDGTIYHPTLTAEYTVDHTDVLYITGSGVAGQILFFNGNEIVHASTPVGSGNHIRILINGVSNFNDIINLLPHLDLDPGIYSGRTLASSLYLINADFNSNPIGNGVPVFTFRKNKDTYAVVENISFNLNNLNRIAFYQNITKKAINNKLNLVRPTITTTAPTDNEIGDQWFNPTTGQLYIYTE